MRSPSPFVRYLLCIFGTVLLGSLSGLVTIGAIETWYTTLNKPWFNPPNWVFGPVWTVLYILMGTAAAMVWTNGHDRLLRRRALWHYAFQLALNLSWSLVFFGLRSPVGALVIITLLLFTIGLCIRSFRMIDVRAAWLLYPYLAWVSFATVLNAAIVYLN